MENSNKKRKILKKKKKKKKKNVSLNGHKYKERKSKVRK
jgi:hypothetical protein